MGKSQKALPPQVLAWVIALDELKIPKGLRPMADEIVGITDSVCLAVLDEE